MSSAWYSSPFSVAPVFQVHCSCTMSNYYFVGAVAPHEGRKYLETKRSCSVPVDPKKCVVVQRIPIDVCLLCHDQRSPLDCV